METVRCDRCEHPCGARFNFDGRPSGSETDCCRAERHREQTAPRPSADADGALADLTRGTETSDSDGSSHTKADRSASGEDRAALPERRYPDARPGDVARD